MAVVGQAYVVVRAITDKVESDIKRGFNGASTSAGKAGKDMGNALTRGLGNSFKKNNSFTNLGSQIKELYPEAENASKAFTRLMRTGYTAQSGLGALAGSLGALVGGLGALVGAAGAASGALVALGSAAISLKVGFAVAGFALKGISQAVSAATKTNGGYSKSLQQIKFDAEEAALGVDRAGLNLEKAKEGLARVADLAPNNRIRREAALAVKEAELALRKAKDAEKNPDGGGGGSDPYADLTPAQKQFAKFLAGLEPQMARLKEAAAKGFLPILEQQMQRLIDAGLIDVLEKQFYNITRGMGEAAKNFTDVFLSGKNMENFNIVLQNIATLLPSFGTSAGNLFAGLLSALKAADPVTRKFVDFLEKKSSAFAKFLDTKEQSGELTAFFNKAGIVAAKFGKIFGQALGGLGNIIAANFGPGTGGDILLEWLDKVTLGWKNMDMVALQGYFKGAADNFTAMADALGGGIETIIKAGSNPAIKEFWDTLDSGSYAFKQIIDGAVDSAPALGRLIQSLTEIVAVFADSSQVVAFFDTLNHMANGAAEILKAIKPLIDWVGPIIGTISAVGLLVGVMTKLGLVTLGFLGKAVTGLGVLLPNSMMATAGATKVATLAMQGFNLTNPIGWIVLAISAIAALGAALAGIHGSNVEKAMNGVNQGFKDGADAAKIWEQATLATVNGPHKEIIKDLDGMKSQMDRLGKAQKSWSYALPSTTALADSFGAMGRSLANMATTDLPSAQKALKKFKDESKLNNKEVAIALDEMDEYKKTLIEQADQMGINIRTLSGEIDMQKLATFAVGEGEVARRRAKEVQDAFNKSIDDAAASFVDYQGNLNQNKDDVRAWAEKQAASTKDANDSWKDYWDGQSFSMDKYLSDLEKQKKAAQKWRDNIAKLTGQLPEEIMTKVVAMGEAGAQLVAGLTDGVNDKKERERFIASFGDLGFTAGTALTTGLNKKLPNGVTLRSLMEPTGKGGGRKDGGYIGSYASSGLSRKFALGGFVSGAGTARSDSIPAMLSNGEYVVNARATAQNRQLLEAINSNRNVSAGAPQINVTVNPSAGMDEKALANEVSRQLAFQIRRGGI